MLLRGYYFAQNARLRYAERAYFGEIIKKLGGCPSGVLSKEPIK